MASMRGKERGGNTGKAFQAEQTSSARMMPGTSGIAKRQRDAYFILFLIFRRSLHAQLGA